MNLTTGQKEMILMSLKNEARTLKHMDDDLVRRGIIVTEVRQTLNRKIMEVATLIQSFEQDLSVISPNIFE